MSYVWRAAMEQRRRHGVLGLTQDTQLVAMCARIDLTIHHDYTGFRDGLMAAMTTDGIWLRRGLRRSQERWLIAHCLGHICVGAQATDGYGCEARGLVERPQCDAEAFAGWLIFGDLILTLVDGDPWDLAAMAKLPVTWVMQWLEMTGQSKEKRREAVG